MTKTIKINDKYSILIFGSLRNVDLVDVTSKEYAGGEILRSTRYRNNEELEAAILRYKRFIRTKDIEKSLE